MEDPSTKPDLIHHPKAFTATQLVHGMVLAVDTSVHITSQRFQLGTDHISFYMR